MNLVYGEPAVVTGNFDGTGTDDDGNSSNLETAGMPEGSTAQEFLTQLQEDFTAMAKSVARYGGFYISRYEIGAGGSSKKGQKVLTADDPDDITEDDNYLGANTWYGLYNTIKNSGANKQMIWGCQYDQVIKFLRENGEDPENGHTYIAPGRALSGQNEQDKMLNIYDLEGNNCEWTAEASSYNYRSYRGSSYNHAYRGIFHPASCLYVLDPSSSTYSDSSRTTLYL